MAAALWRSFPCSRQQLRLDTVLLCGQSFRWREDRSGEWIGVAANRVWRLKQDETHIYYQVFFDSDASNSKVQPDTKAVPVKREDMLKCKGSDTVHRNRKRKTATEQAASVEVELPEEVTRRPVKGRARKGSTHPKVSSSGKRTDHLPGKYALCKIKEEKGDEIFVGNSDETQESKDSIDVSILWDYFQLDVDVESLYKSWSSADPYFRKTATDFAGIRILRQDPVENLFSFICSSNNHISRISSMVEKLCSTYGQPIAEVDGKMYYSFPQISSLALEGVEENLRVLGFGYRAKFIAASAKYIRDNNGEDWLFSLRHAPYAEAKVELMKLHGVGAKVADCVCLMSLDKTDAIPVDTHVWQLAAQHYLPKLRSVKNLTDKLYQEIAEHFQGLWGLYAGWAQSVLFTSELRHMQHKKATDDEGKVPAAVSTKKRRNNSPSKSKLSKKSTT